MVLPQIGARAGRITQRTAGITWRCNGRQEPMPDSCRDMRLRLTARAERHLAPGLHSSPSHSGPDFGAGAAVAAVRQIFRISAGGAPEARVPHISKLGRPLKPRVGAQEDALAVFQRRPTISD